VIAQVALLTFVLGAALAATPGNPSKPAPATQKPAPYRSVEVQVTTRDGQTLAGTLTLPKGVAKPPVMLLLSSATRSDRDASGLHGPYHPFRQISDTLSRNGIAVLRLDDRGAGGSTGSIDSMNTAERANDARDALAFLKQRPDVDPRRIGVLGHSEGGQIAGIVAAEDTTIRAVILMATSAHIGRNIIEWEQRYSVQSARILPMAREREFQKAMAAWKRHAADDHWAAFFDTYDPLPTMTKVRAPVLILQGTADVSCPEAEADVLSAAIKNAGNPDVTLQKVVGVDHAFLRLSGFQNGVAYGDGAYLVTSVALGAIAGWSVKHLR